MAAGEREGRAIAERVREAMQSAGIGSVEELAERAGLVPRTLARRLATGPEDFRVDELARVAAAVGQPFEFLYWGITLEVAA